MALWKKIAITNKRDVSPKFKKIKIKRPPMTMRKTFQFLK